MLKDIFSLSINIVKFSSQFQNFTSIYKKNIQIEQQSPRNPTQIMPNSCEIIYAEWRREMMGQRRLRRRRRRPRWCDPEDDDDDENVTPASSKASRGGGEDGNSPDAAPVFV